MLSLVSFFSKNRVGVFFSLFMFLVFCESSLGLVVQSCSEEEVREFFPSEPPENHNPPGMTLYGVGTPRYVLLSGTDGRQWKVSIDRELTAQENVNLTLGPIEVKSPGGKSEVEAFAKVENDLSSVAMRRKNESTQQIAFNCTKVGDQAVLTDVLPLWPVYLKVRKDSRPEFPSPMCNSSTPWDISYNYTKILVMGQDLIQRQVVKVEVFSANCSPLSGDSYHVSRDLRQDEEDTPITGRESQTHTESGRLASGEPSTMDSRHGEQVIDYESNHLSKTNRIERRSKSPARGSNYGAALKDHLYETKIEVNNEETYRLARRWYHDHYDASDVFGEKYGPLQKRHLSIARKLGDQITNAEQTSLFQARPMDLDHAGATGPSRTYLARISRNGSKEFAGGERLYDASTSYDVVFDGYTGKVESVEGEWDGSYIREDGTSFKMHGALGLDPRYPNRYGVNRVNTLPNGTIYDWWSSADLYPQSISFFTEKENELVDPFPAPSHILKPVGEWIVYFGNTLEGVELEWSYAQGEAPPR